jgi:hypothetical protein
MVLLDFRFFVDHVLANNWVKFLDFHLVRHSALVLISGVVVASLGARNQLNQISHNRCLYIANLAMTRLYANAIVSNIR